MSHFYGTVQGSRGQATRQGGKNAGLETYAASWKGAVRVMAYYDEATDTDCVRVDLTTWHGHGIHRVLYHGPIDSPDAPLGVVQ